MRILRNVLLMVFPLLIMINLYRFVFYSDEYTFRGLSFLHENLQSFPGLDLTFKMIEELQLLGTEISNMEVNSIFDIAKLVQAIFELIGRAVGIPIIIVVNVCMNLWWFIHTMFIA